MTKPICSFDGCNRPRIGNKDYCNPHTVQQRRGKPLTPIQEQGLSKAARIARHADKRGPFVPGHPEMGRCWQWLGGTSKSSNGMPYGAVGYQKKTFKAHRFSWEAHNGPIPEGLEIDHICHNSLCVRPAHLRLATRAQNREHLRGVTARNKDSGVRNVHKSRNRWQVVVRGKYIGQFATIEEAAEVAARVRAEMFDFPDF